MKARRRVFPQLLRMRPARETCIFYNANAPFAESQVNGAVSKRSHKEALMGDRVKLTSMAKAAG